MRTVLFYRDFRQFSGGHLKVWHYFNHVLSSPDHEAWVRFSPTSVWDETNPWQACPERVLAPGARMKADVVFLAGLDWLSLSGRQRRRPRRPVVNLVQHVRYAVPTDPRFAFLRHPAVRICVSTEVREAIVATGQANGPVLTVPNGVDVGEGGRAPSERDLDVLVVANKQPAMGRRLAERLLRLDRRVRLVDNLVPRSELLDLLRRARATLFLPNRTEGFYLPALEGMALGTLVVCPDCIGNRSFCLPGENCLRPAFEEDALIEGVEHVLALRPAAAGTMLMKAAATASAHSLAGERSAFLAILGRLDRLRMD